MVLKHKKKMLEGDLFSEIIMKCLGIKERFSNWKGVRLAIENKFSFS